MTAIERLKQYFAERDPGHASKNSSEAEIIDDATFLQQPAVEPQQVFRMAGPTQAEV